MAIAVKPQCISKLSQITTYVFIILIYRAFAEDCQRCKCCAYQSCYGSNYRNIMYEDLCHNGCISRYWGPECTTRCNDNCKTCDQYRGCTECQDGYYLSNGECMECYYKQGRGCKCAPEEECRGCMSGSYMYRAWCYKCPVNCLECTDQSTCTKCTAGRHGTNCLNNCKHTNCFCSSANRCDSCRDGFYGVLSNCQNQCHYNCVSCRNSFQDCNFDCKPGYYGRDCSRSCSLGCLKNECDKDTGYCKCRTNFLGPACVDCKHGWYGEECQWECNQTCRTCDDKTYCTSCYPGFYGQLCNAKCPTNCRECTSNYYCITCNSGFYGDYCQNNCYIGCLNTQCEKTTGNCSSCKDGYYGPRCEHICPDGCKNNICSQSSAECTHGCKHERYSRYCCPRDKFGITCLQQCQPNCVKCTSWEVCQSCKEGYYGVQCESNCPSNCQTCDSPNNCFKCRDGYLGSSCERFCSANCRTCNPTGTCLSCIDNYMHPEKNCLCTTSLDICLSDECSSCSNSTYYPYYKACCPCCNTCKQSACLSPTQCTHGCEDGYFGLGCQYICAENDARCMVCSGEHVSNCELCISGYYPDADGQCTGCPQACINKTCNSSSGHCEHGCLDGFWESKCDIKCNCSVCEQNSGECLVCSSASLYGSKCDIACNNTCINASCHMNGTCTKGCISNYYGPSCETLCSTNCAGSGNESRCSPEAGLCLFGCSAGFTGDDCMHALKQDSDGKPVPSAAIGGGVAAVVIVALVVVIGLFVYIRRNREPKPDLVQEASNNAVVSFVSLYVSVTRSDNTGSVYENTSSVTANVTAGDVHNPVYSNTSADRNVTREVIPSATEDSLEIDELDNMARQNAIRFEENGGVYYNNDNEVKKFKIPVLELQKFVMSKDMDYFKTEFEKLPYGLLKDYRVSQLKANIAKNRYKGIYPYDDHRVKVLGGDTDYINASFIDGYKSRNAYIATLGPMSKQLGYFSAFWKMVWQHKVEKIVMVTNLVEEGKDKCEQYWPNAGASQMYGDVRVLCQNEGEFADFTRRKFTLVKNEEERTLNQLHFTAWPDKDVPEDVTSIIEFRQNVMRAPAVLGGPDLVHCSAGVGRTGTYIALDILTKEGEAEGAIDVAGCVLNMRQNRPNMVQTAGQYEYLHHAVVHSLTFDCKPVTGEKFQSYLDRTSKDQIIKMFQQLQGTTKYGSLDETEAVERNAKHTDKNREGSDIPGDEHRPRLYLNRKPGSPDYINAVFVNSFKTKNKYILAQSPLPNPIADFLALIVQSECACIVSFESTSMQAKDVGVYFPADNQVLKKGIFSVRCSKPEANAYRIKRSLTIEHQTNQARNEENSITHMEFTEWNTEQNIPNSPSAFRRFIAEVDAVTSNTNADKPIIIHCMDGASKCGLFCVVATLIQKMEVEHEVSVVNTVRQVKSRRKGAIPSNEQFQFCHDCVLDYIQSFDIYSNFAADLSDC